MGKKQQVKKNQPVEKIPTKANIAKSNEGTVVKKESDKTDDIEEKKPNEQLELKTEEVKPEEIDTDKKQTDKLSKKLKAAQEIEDKKKKEEEQQKIIDDKLKEAVAKAKKLSEDQLNGLTVRQYFYENKQFDKEILIKSLERTYKEKVKKITDWEEIMKSKNIKF